MLLIPSCRHGAQNAYDGASKQTLENEFGTSNEDECMIKILEKGDIQETEVGLPASDWETKQWLTYYDSDIRASRTQERLYGFSCGSLRDSASIHSFDEQTASSEVYVLH